MAGDLNRVVLIGRITKDPDLRSTQTGSSVANFSIANNRIFVTGGEKKEQTSFFNCIAWGKVGEAIAQYCKKGHRIGIEGHLQQRSWDDQSGNKRTSVEIVVDGFQFLQPKTDGADQPAPAPAQESTGDNPFSDEEIPF
jgi:single-strand DNA-binding protein